MLKTKVLIGIDLGQQNDYTVMSVVEILDQDTMHSMGGFFYELTWLHRFKLKTSYPSIVNMITTVVDRTFEDNEYMLLVDYTGVGRPVVDMLRKNELNLIAINITGGNKCNWRFGNEASVPKKELVTSLQVVLQSNRIIWHPDIHELAHLKKEFLNFKTIKPKDPTLTLKYSAASGYHDDIVMAISLATWYGEYASQRTKRRRIISGN